MADKSDNVKTNSKVTAPGEKGATVETVFIETTFDNDTKSHMNMPNYTRTTKSGGESVLEGLPCPI